MKNIITALNNPDLNMSLKSEENVNIINKDIIYKEGIIEILELKKNINLIIINYELPGKIKIEELIEKIRRINEKIEIIFILEKEDIEKEKILKKYNINNIYYNNKIDKNELVGIINRNRKSKEEELQEEIEKLKNIIEKKEMSERNQENKKEESKKNKHLIKKNETELKRKSIYKYEGFRKVILIEEDINQENHLSIDILNKLDDKNIKILIVDLKIGYEDLHLIFNKKNALNKIRNKLRKTNQYSKEKYQINNNIEKINKNFFITIKKNVKLLTGLKYLLYNKEQNPINKIINIINKNISKYDFLIIEILNKNQEELNKKIIEKTRKIILILSNNFYDIKKTKLKIEKYKDFNNPKIFLFVNQKKFNSFKLKNVNIKIIQEVFKKSKIIKKINKKTIKRIIKN